MSSPRPLRPEDAIYCDNVPSICHITFGLEKVEEDCCFGYVLLKRKVITFAALDAVGAVPAPRIVEWRPEIQKLRVRFRRHLVLLSWKKPGKSYRASLRAKTRFAGSFPTLLIPCPPVSTPTSLRPENALEVARLLLVVA